MKKRSVLILLTALFAISVLSCGRPKTPPVDPDSNAFHIYFQEQNRKELVAIESVIDMDLPSDLLIPSIFEHMKVTAQGSGYVSAVASDLELKSFSFGENSLLLGFDKSFGIYEPTAKCMLQVAALVLTYSQLEGVSSVEIRVDSQPLTRADGSAIGPMTASMFTDILGNGLNAYTRMSLTLFFTDATGTKLISGTSDVSFRNNLSPEEVVIRRLIKGPDDPSKGYPVLPQNLEVYSVRTVDGVCHVNLSDAFLSGNVQLDPEVIVYSIVDSLTELNGISGVLISVNGSSNVTLMDTVDLSKELKRNLNLVETPEPDHTEEP